MQNFLRFFYKKMKMINACTHIFTLLIYQHAILIVFLELISKSSRTDIAVPGSGRMSCSAHHHDRSNMYHANSSTR